jgi:Protein of unknown function (DUF2971)
MKTAAQQGVQRLYHYQGADLKYLRDTLVNHRVHFSNPKNFNDPWDCHPYFEPAIDDAESRRKWGERLDGMYESLPAALRVTLEAKWEGNWYDHKELLRQSIEKLTGWVRQFTVERWRIYCLTPHPDSVLMWAHYAEKHKGICLEFDGRNEQVGRAYRVLYKDAFPIIGPDEFNDPKALVDAVLLTKSQEWAYEDEYRILARGEDLLALTPGALTGIVGGCNADTRAIQSVVDECSPGLRVKRAVRMPDRYHIDINDDLITVAKE